MKVQQIKVAVVPENRRTRWVGVMLYIVVSLEDRKRPAILIYSNNIRLILQIWFEIDYHLFLFQLGDFQYLHEGL